MKVMIWNAARGGMRSVVEAYRRDGFIEGEDVRLIHAYCDGGFVKRQLVLVAALARFLVCLLGQRIELVHIHAAMRGSFWRKSLFATLARLFGVPVILHLHGSEMKPFYQSQPPFAQRAIRRQLEAASRVLVLSQSWKTFVGGIAPAAAITVVPNYVALPPPIEPARRVWSDILFLGLIGPRKGTFDLIEAFAAIAADRPQARLVIGGNGQVEEARALVQRLNLETRVVLAGWVDGPAKAELIATSGIYVLPSYNEGLPMSVLEAMAAGLAVVTTRVGGIPELMTDGVDGLLVEPGDKPALSRALATLLDDAPTRSRLAEAGRARIESHYSDKVVLPLLHQIYGEVRRR